MVRNFIDLDIFSICKRNGFDNEALTQIAEKSAELIDWFILIYFNIKIGDGLNYSL